MKTTTTRKTFARVGLAGAVSIAMLAGASGCNNAGEGAISGATIGALGGLAIGSLSGDAGKGAIIGAVAGGAGGAVIGDQNQRRDQRERRRYEDNYDYDY